MEGMNEKDLTSENDVFFQRQGHSFEGIAHDPFEDDYGSEARVSMVRFYIYFVILTLRCPQFFLPNSAIVLY
jgi:hypothetical protein